MIKKINCSIIGLGRIGSLLEKDKKREKPATHAGAVYHNKDCCFLSACDLDEERNEQFKKTWKCSNLFTHYQDLLNYQLPDILHIATPPEAHYEICSAAIEKKVPVIICEKPFTNSLKEASKIAELALKSNTKIIINHERRYSQNYIDLKKMLDQKTYGRLLNISARLYMGFGKKLKDLLWHDGTHMVDILRFLTSEELNFQYLHGDLDQENSICDIGFIAGNIPINIQAATDRKYLAFEMDIYLDQALIRIGNGIFEIHESCPSPFYDKFLSLVPKNIRKYKKTGYFSNMMNEALTFVNSKKSQKKPCSNVEDGVKSVAIIQSLLLL